MENGQQREPQHGLIQKKSNTVLSGLEGGAVNAALFWSSLHNTLFVILSKVPPTSACSPEIFRANKHCSCHSFVLRQEYRNSDPHNSHLPCLSL